MRTLRLIAITLLLLLQLMPADAQTKLWIQGGPNYSWLRYKNTDNSFFPRNYFEHAAAASVQWSFSVQQPIFNEHLSVQAGLQGTVKKYLIQFPSFPGSRDYEPHHLFYFELPIALQAEVLPGIRVETGMAISHLVNEYRKGTRMISSEDRFDLNWLAGIQWSLGSRWGVQLRYTHGLVPLATLSTFVDATTGGTQFEQQWFNRSLQLGLAYALVER